MKQHIIDYISSADHILVSPIWGGQQEFHFLCLGYLDISQALGFELVEATPVLTVVKENQLTEEGQLEELISKKEFDWSVFDREIEVLCDMQKNEKQGLCGGGCFGPLTVVSGILGAERMLKMTVKNPDFVQRFVEYVTGFLVELAKRETAKNQDFFWIAEPVASLLSPKKFWTLSGQYLKQIYDAAQVPGFFHVCGDTTKHTKLLEETGAEVLSIDYCVDIGQCINEVKGNTVIMGNVNPINLRYGTKDDVVKEVQGILDACRGHKNFVMSTGCSMVGGTPDENMQVLFDMCEKQRGAK